MNLHEANRFVSAVVGSTTAPATWQTFCDDPERKNTPEGQQLSRVLHGSFEDVKSLLVEASSKGAGIFLQINEGDLKGSTNENIIALRAVFIDDDSGDRPVPRLEPSLAVRSGNGYHLYWFLRPGEKLDRYKDAQRHLSNFFYSDKSVCDLRRVMRVPGFPNQKNPNEPKAVHVLEEKLSNRYTIDDVLGAHPVTAEMKKAAAGATDYLTNPKRKKPHPDRYTQTSPGRHEYLVTHGGWLARYGLYTEERIRQLNEHDCSPPLTNDELQDVLRSCSKYEPTIQLGARVLKELKGATVFEVYEWAERRKAPNFADITDLFIESEGIEVRRFNQDFFIYSGGYWRREGPDELAGAVMRFFQSPANQMRHLATGHSQQNVLSGLGSGVVVGRPPFWLSAEAGCARPVSVANGILDLDGWLEGRADVLLSHTPNLFCLGKLPFEYRPEAQCPTWLAFLDDAIPDTEIRQFLQEWAGYNLIPDTAQQRWVILFGDGKEGKSVYCLMLKLLLGAENYSSIPLEAFSPNRTYFIAETEGKLANIVTEIGEVERAAEGVIKQFVSGESITVERKHRNPFQLQPTARLTFSTNNLPVFSDKSDGIWRRLVIVPFKNQKEETEQNKDLVCPDFWVGSGELPGVFNWALEGLRRLLARGHFIEPGECAAQKQSYREEFLGARNWLKNNFMEVPYNENDPDTYIARSVLWKAYNEYAKQAGEPEMRATAFAREVQKVFKKAGQAKNPKHIRRPDGVEIRDRVWGGVRGVGLVALKRPGGVEVSKNLT